MAKKEGRGRLSSIELLPSEADEAVVWAAAELLERSRTADDIHAEFNGRLAEIGLGPISRSAFHRYSMRKAAMQRNTQMTKMIMSGLAEDIKVKDIDDATVVLGNTLKMVVFEILERGSLEGFSPKETKELSAAYKSIVTAEAIPAKYRRMAEAKFERAVTEAVQTAGKEAGLSKDQVEQIKRDVLGVRPKAEPE